MPEVLVLQALQAPKTERDIGNFWIPTSKLSQILSLTN
jgi:hypothetical protein